MTIIHRLTGFRKGRAQKTRRELSFERIFMKPVVGVICEYDPFHRGHARQFALIRERLPDAAIVCVMSGCFTQRGAAALFAPHSRARQALEAGADVVLELPCAFSVREAENFALGGVGLLQQLGFVTHLSFGCEDEIAPLEQAATLLEHPTADFQQVLKTALAAGRPFAAAQGLALEACMGAEAASIAKPNNTLAVCYLRALLRLCSSIQPLPVHREGSYHASTLDEGWPSASAVRNAFLAGNLSAAEAACGYSLQGIPYCAPNALELVLLDRLRGMSSDALRALPGCSEGLENRLYTAARMAVDRESLLAALKTKRYPYARLSRMTTHALLGATEATFAREPLPSCTRLLGFRRSSETLLSGLRQSKLTVSAKATQLSALDQRACDLWALGAGLPAGWVQRQPVVICENARFDVQ